MTTTQKTKIIIYDSSRTFYRSITQSSSDNCKIENVFNYKNPERINFEQYDRVLFIVNKSMEVFDLMLIYDKVKNIYVAAESNHIINHLKSVKGVKTMNLKENKKKISAFLNII